MWPRFARRHSDSSGSCETNMAYASGNGLRLRPYSRSTQCKHRRREGDCALFSKPSRDWYGASQASRCNGCGRKHIRHLTRLGPSPPHPGREKQGVINSKDARNHPVFVPDGAQLVAREASSRRQTRPFGESRNAKSASDVVLARRRVNTAEKPLRAMTLRPVTVRMYIYIVEQDPRCRFSSSRQNAHPEIYTISRRARE